MKLNQFRDVVAIVEQGSLRAAARQLGLAQPALSRSIRELEHELGASLFERRSRGMVLTPMGEAFVVRAGAILRDVKRVSEEIDQLCGNVRGSVVVALSIAAHLVLFPKILKPFRTRFPDVRLHVIEGFYPTVEHDLKEGKIDFYVGPEPKGPLPPELLTEQLFPNMRTVIGRKGHPLAKSRSLGDLASAEWATTSITTTEEDELGTLFATLKLPPPRLVLRCQSALTLIVALTNSDILAMVPRQWTEFKAIAELFEEIQVAELLRAPPMVLIRRAGLPLTPAAEYFSDLLKRCSDREAAALIPPSIPRR